MDNIKLIQRKELAILKEFIRICEKHQLTYYILGGTLLGAVRHQGFIPWDDDIDIGMPRTDYEFLMNLPQEEFKAPYQLVNEKVNPEFTKAFMNLQDKSTSIIMTYSNERSEQALWIDIFPLDGMPANKVKKYWHGKHYLFARMMVQLSQFNKIVNVNKKNRPLLEKVIIKLADVFKIENVLNYKKYQQYYIKVISKYDMSEEYAGNYTGAYKLREIVPSKYFGRGTVLQFEDLMVNAPMDYIGYLEAIYGPNYMELPPIEDRAPHQYEIIKL
ncbi:LicD family protein [Streptococcus cuniculipharyngis]|uniref:LicD family protein n=1 Tax=Streptococcus cuniculipharyngis TaxID=1562651 RepID=A0A5C5SC42_9STRE|nr:LicD family protein [Streptococcus cuniculipharyngis]TWS97643.1 LicD family protein [Streptococcus cuniculipharyngis]